MTQNTDTKATAAHASAAVPTSASTGAPRSTADAPEARLVVARAIGWFLIAYAAVTVLCAALSMAIGAAVPAPDTPDPTKNHAYVLSEHFDPLVNLAVWTACACFYLRGSRRRPPDRQSALLLSALWIGLALPVDFIGFVVIKNPFSLTPHQFYVGQAPWIYVTYTAVVASPWCAAVLMRRRRAA